MVNKLNWLKQLFVNNWALKLLSIVLAALSLHAISGVTGFEVTYEVPVRVEVEEGIAILDQYPGSVLVTFRGSQDDILALGLVQNQIRAVARPDEADLGESVKVDVVSARIEGASGVKVVKVMPESVAVTFDREVEKTFPVARPQTIGSPLIGKVELDYEPRFVKIRGPKLRLEEQEKKVVQTEPVDVDGRVKSFSKRVRVLPPIDTGVSRIEPSEVTVKVNIVTETVQLEWTNITVLAIMEHTAGMGVSCEPSTVNVTLSGRAEMINSVTEKQIKAFVDCVGLQPGTAHRLRVDVHLPAGIDVTPTVEPEEVMVSLEKAVEGGEKKERPTADALNNEDD